MHLDLLADCGHEQNKGSYCDLENSLRRILNRFDTHWCVMGAKKSQDKTTHPSTQVILKYDIQIIYHELPPQPL
jgi:hypothetical protein